jgi:hypothetical protein
MYHIEIVSKKVLFSRLPKGGQMPKSMFFILYDAKVKPISLHGSEILEFAPRECVEVIHRYSCKHYVRTYMRVYQNLCNDCGRLPLWFESTKRMIKYRLKI